MADPKVAKKKASKPKMIRALMIQCQSGPSLLRLPKHEYDVPEDEFKRMEAAGICVAAG